MMLNSLIIIIFTGAYFISCFIDLNILSPENVQLLLDELRYLYGTLWEFSRRINGPNWYSEIIIFHLNLLKISLNLLDNFLQSSEDSRLQLARHIIGMLLGVIDTIISLLRGGN